VESSFEFGIEPLGSIKFWDTIVLKQLGISQVVLSSMELVSYVERKGSSHSFRQQRNFNKKNKIPSRIQGVAEM
jgi:hypothetical protein